MLLLGRKQRIAMVHAMEATIAALIRTHMYFKSMKQWPFQIFVKRCGSDSSQHPCRTIISSFHLPSLRRQHSLPSATNETALSRYQSARRPHSLAINLQGDRTLYHQLSICRETILSTTSYQSAGRSHSLPPAINLQGDHTLYHQLSICREITLSTTSYQSAGRSHSLPPAINLQGDHTLYHQLSICGETMLSTTSYQSAGRSHSLPPAIYLQGDHTLYHQLSI